MRVKNLLLCGLFAALTAIGAFIKIPMWPSALTLQTMITAMAGLILGAKLGALSQLVYVLLGLIGLPIFTQGGGPGYVFQPTFGFLIGLVPCAYIVGLVGGRRPGIRGAAAGIAAGFAALYAIGIPYLWLIVNRVAQVEMSFWKALMTGMVIFIPGDIIKAAAASLISVRLRKTLGKAGYIVSIRR